MKKLMILALILSLSFTMLLADDDDYDEDDLDTRIKMEIEKELQGTPGSPKINITMKKQFDMQEQATDAAYFGIFVEDLNFPKAQELGYTGNIGVLVTGVVPDSPAWEYRLQEDDIITAIDGKEITNYAAFEKVRKQYRAGDQVQLDIFRSGEMISSDFTFGSRGGIAPQAPGSPDVAVKQKLSVGYGGGSYIPMWFMPELDDVNHLIGAMGFPELDDNGIFMQGGGGKGHIGKGYFLGGAIYTYENAQKKSDPVDPTYNIWLRYENTMGGVTLDKRFALSRKIITSTGVMLGGGKHTVEFLKSNSNFDWDNWYNTALNSNNTHNTISRGYLIVQPRVELMYRLLPWLGLRAEGNYTYGYSTKKGWKIEGLDGDNIVVMNSPDTPYQGFGISIGPWFGF